MKTKVTEQGIVVPAEMLDGAKEVELRKEHGRVVVIPLMGDDPILSLGQDPVSCNVPDASEKPDRVLYGPGCPVMTDAGE